MHIEVRIKEPTLETVGRESFLWKGRGEEPGWDGNPARYVGGGEKTEAFLGTSGE